MGRRRWTMPRPSSRQAPQANWFAWGACKLLEFANLIRRRLLAVREDYVLFGGHFLPPRERILARALRREGKTFLASIEVIERGAAILTGATAPDKTAEKPPR